MFVTWSGLVNALSPVSELATPTELMQRCFCTFVVSIYGFFVMLNKYWFGVTVIMIIQVQGEQARGLSAARPGLWVWIGNSGIR